MTLTFDLPESLVQEILALPEAERNRHTERLWYMALYVLEQRGSNASMASMATVDSPHPWCPFTPQNVLHESAAHVVASPLAEALTHPLPYETRCNAPTPKMIGETL